MLRWQRRPFFRDLVMVYRKKDIASGREISAEARAAAPWREVPNSLPVTSRIKDYPEGTSIAPHRHDRHQLVYSAAGLMVVRSENGRWVVPSTRAIWMPAGTVHAVDCIGSVQMRSVYIDPLFAPQLAVDAFAVRVSPLLRELLDTATRLQGPYVEDSRDGRVLRLMLDELQRMDVLPLHLPEPVDTRLQRICSHLQRHPEDSSTLQDWGRALAVDAKTLQRRFAAELGMTFGQWRQQARLLAAMQQLARGDKVINVALAMGYDSPSAFTSMFKRQLGQTPAAFFR